MRFQTWIISAILLALPASAKEDEFSRIGLPSALDVSEPARGNSLKALEAANREILSRPNSPKGYMMRGIYYLGALEDELAIKEFDRVIKMHPRFSQAYLQRGIAHEHIEKYQDAFKDYEKAAESTDTRTRWQALKASGSLHSNLCQYIDAIEDFSNALKIAPEPPMLLRRGECYFQLKNFDNAIKDATECLVLMKENHRSYWLRAQAQIGAKRPVLAIKDMSRLIQLTESGSPDSCFELLPQYYKFRAQCYMQLGNKDLAKKDLDRAKVASADALKEAPFKNRPKP